jgi:hypothetical protein
VGEVFKSSQFAALAVVVNIRHLTLYKVYFEGAYEQKNDSERALPSQFGSAIVVRRNPRHPGSERRKQSSGKFHRLGNAKEADSGTARTDQEVATSNGRSAKAAGKILAKYDWFRDRNQSSYRRRNCCCRNFVGEQQWPGEFDPRPELGGQAESPGKSAEDDNSYWFAESLRI